MDGNESQIQNLASILLNNALSYTPEYGSIYGKKQNVSYTMKGDQVTFSFADDTINGTWTGDQLLAADGWLPCSSV